jgi:hypothetical protein
MIVREVSDCFHKNFKNILMNVFIKVHRCEFLRITTKIQKEIKQWVRAKCEHEGMLQQGYNLLMISKKTPQNGAKGTKKECQKHHKKGHQEHHKEKHPRGRLG